MVLQTVTVAAEVVATALMMMLIVVPWMGGFPARQLLGNAGGHASSRRSGRRWIDCSGSSSCLRLRAPARIVVVRG